MKNLFLTLALALVATAAFAQPSALQLLQQQLAASPAAQQATQSAQQAVMQQAIQQMAANPQLLTSMVNSLTPQQQTTLMQQALVAGQQIFTQQEQAKIAAFTASPEGASIAAKMPQLVQALAPTVLQMVASRTATGATVAPAAGH